MNKEIHALNLQLSDMERARNRARAATADLRKKLMETDKVLGELYFASSCGHDGHDSKSCRMCKHFSRWFAMKEGTASDQENPEGGAVKKQNHCDYCGQDYELGRDHKCYG